MSVDDLTAAGGLVACSCNTVDTVYCLRSLIMCVQPAGVGRRSGGWAGSPNLVGGDRLADRPTACNLHLAIRVWCRRHLSAVLHISSAAARFHMIVSGVSIGRESGCQQVDCARRWLSR